MSQPLKLTLSLEEDQDHHHHYRFTLSSIYLSLFTSPCPPFRLRPPSTSSTLLLNTAKPTPLLNSRARIGLSKRHSIPSLLRRVDRNKEAPKTIEKKEKVTKAVLEAREQERIAREEAEAEGREYVPLDTMRGKDGLLIEWDF